MLDFITNNAGLLAGGTGGGIVLYILKKVPNKEICAWVESISVSYTHLTLPTTPYV